MKKILFITNLAKNVGSFSIGCIMAAHTNDLEFHLAANWQGKSAKELQEDEKKYDIKEIHIDLSRTPYSLNNIKAFKQLIDYIKKEKIDFIHCNTPVGGILGRLVGEKCNVKKIIYQVHGFHFYKGAPLKNWLIYYPIEKWLAKKTDVIITINKEDYKRAKNFKLKKDGKIYYVPGVGIDLSRYTKNQTSRQLKRKELELKETDVAIFSVGELNKNKNNKVIIEAIARLKETNIHYFLCGKGPLEPKLKKLVKKKNLEKRIHFLGYRTDVDELLHAADIFVMPSFREGLSRSIMEAMACGLPCLISNIRGNSDLIQEDIGGYLLDPNDIDGFAYAIEKCIRQPELRRKMKNNNINKIKDFSIDIVVDKLIDIYKNELVK